MTGSANYGTYANTEEELDTFLRHSIKPFMKRRLNELDSLRAKNEHLQHALMCAETDRDHAIAELDAAIKDRNHWHDKWVATDRALGEATHPTTLPRVITAEEVERGMTLAAESMVHSGRWYVGVAGPVGLVDKNSGTLQIHFSKAATIVLLAHAPDAKDINVAKETVKGEYPDNPWFATVYEDATYLADTWRGTPVTPQSIRAGDLYDIHTAHGSRITGVVAARNGVRNPQPGDQYRLVTRKA